jgi:hypothetical protein
MPVPDRSTSRTDAAPRRAARLVGVLGVGLCGLAAGCRSNQRYELIEAELRTRERELLECRGELQHARLLNQTYQRSLARPGCPPGAGPADAVPALPLKEIALASGTGGADNDGLPGDEALQVVVVPRDDDGSAVKVPAAVVVEAFEIGRNGVKVPIGRWDVPPEAVRRTWRGGLFATGYYLLLQWDRPPTTDRVRVAVRLTTLDGRPYEADRDVSVRPLPGLVPGPAAGPVPVIPPPGLPGPAEELPPPGVESRRPTVRVRPAVPAAGNGP